MYTVLEYFGEDLVVWLTATSVFVSVYVVWAALIAPRPLRSRIKQLNERRTVLHSARLVPHTHPFRGQFLEVANSVVRRLRLLHSSQTRKIEEQLDQAGWRGHDALVLFLFCKFALPIFFGALAILFLYILEIIPMADIARLMVAIAMIGIGAYGPDIFVTNAIQKRRQKVQKAMPDGLDLMVICAEAGLSLDSTLDRVSRELRTSWLELADELAITAVELGFLPERNQALENLAKRARIDGIRGLVSTLAQTERYGTPLAQALRVLAAELRTNRLMKAEEKAARLPAVLTVPMIIFILPALFVVLIGPGALRVLDGLRGQGLI